MRPPLLAAILTLAPLAACTSPSDGGGLHGESWWKQSRSVQVGARPEQVVAAVERAFADLHIDVRESRADDEQGLVEGRTSRRGRVSVAVRASSLAASQITVRLDFDQEDALQRILDGILAEL